MNLNDLGERQSRIILDRIHQTEKNVSHVIDAIGAFVRKESRVRDKTDDLAKVIKTISEVEQHNKSTGKAFDNVSNGLGFLADHQSLEIQRIEEKVIQDLSSYQLICQNAKEEVKTQIMLRDRELSKRKQLDMSRRTKNENEVILSNMQISKVLKEISGISEQFEKQKIGDMKESLTNLVLIELKYHASCLEVLTMMYDDVAAIDEKEDVEEFMVQVKRVNGQFKKHLQQNDKTSSGFFLSRIKSQSLGALSSMLDKKPMREKSASKRQLRSISKSTMSLNSLESNDEEDDDKEVRTKSHPQTVEMSAESIETKSSDSEESESESDKTATKEEEKPVKLQIHKVKRFQ